MGIQLIFVVETNKKCNSDWIYINQTIKHFFVIDSHTKLSVVYMNGKTKYREKQKDIQSLTKKYNSTKGNKTHTIYCFDCDQYDTKLEDVKFLEDSKAYCESKGYDFVWFCKDIESVYLKKKIQDTNKGIEAAKFKAKELIKNIKESDLKVQNYQLNKSNILFVTEKYLKRKEI